MPNKIKNLTLLSLTAAICVAGSVASAHTGIKDTGTEGVKLYTAFTISHGCATNAGGETATATSYDGNTTQKDIIAQSALFPNSADSLAGIVDSAGYITSPLNIADVVDGVVAPAGLPLGLAATYPQVFPQSYIVRDASGVARGFQTWGGILPEGGGTLGLSGFAITPPKFKATSCAKSLKLQIAVANYCHPGTKAKDKNSDRMDAWIGEMTAKFNDPLVMPNAAGTPVSTTDTRAKIYWPTLTIKRTSPLPSGCSPADGYDVAIQPSKTDIDTFLPLAKPTKSHPKLVGKKFWPNI
jgi:hypothetical protein